MSAIVTCFVLMFVLQLATPFWWWIMAVPFIFGLWKSRTFRESVRTGMLSAGGLWFTVSLYHHLMGGGLIATRLSTMFELQYSGMMVLIATLIATLAAGLAGGCGYGLQAVWKGRARD